MCHNSDTIIINTSFEPVAIGMSLGQHKIGTYKGVNVYARKLSLESAYFLQMPQKAFNMLKIEKIPFAYHKKKFTVSKKQLSTLKEKLLTEE